MTNFDDIGRLATEAWDASGADLDLRSTPELVHLMHARSLAVSVALEPALPSIAAAIDEITARMRAGGRLVYAGAGTSGRLAFVDAVECETTFATPQGLVVALVAGGASATAAAQEHAEDDTAAGGRDAAALELTPLDSFVVVSASGRTPYALGALEVARAAQALTAGIVCTAGSSIGAAVEHEIAVVVGPELIAGSTRLNAGTAQKLVLNMLSTLVMVRLGKTFGNLMVDVVATNEKLRQRVRQIVANATGADAEAVDAALAEAGGDTRVAIVSLKTGLDATAARDRLERVAGNVREAIAQS